MRDPVIVLYIFNSWNNNDDNDDDDNNNNNNYYYYLIIYIQFTTLLIFEYEQKIFWFNYLLS